MIKLSRSQYLLACLSVYFYPFFAGLSASLIPKPSGFWGGVLGLLSLVWFIWVIVSTILKLYEKPVFRIIPVTILINIGGVLYLVPLWRLSNQSVLLGIVLFASHVSLTIYSFMREKVLVNKQKQKSPKLKSLFGWMAFLGPVFWGMLGFIISGFAGKTFICLIFAFVGYIVTYYSASFTRRLREKPEQTE